MGYALFLPPGRKDVLVANFLASETMSPLTVAVHAAPKNMSQREVSDVRIIDYCDLYAQTFS